ncbi:ABC transporter substrate-binding protein [Streptomyces sp. E11-3]|uniref:ABC transporter substrate-binding protein n=1 Tax=Streptomyces sp. E11-3 TaxID=3110112 RepID=UPI00397E9C88
MTVRLRNVLPRPPKTAALAVAATAVCTSLTVGCGVLPGATGGSGGPVVVMTWAPEKTREINAPGVPAMAKAYARWVNANGGLHGRELKVLTCNDHNDKVGAAECARRAVDEDVVAVVGAFSQHARAFVSPLEAAGIPYIGGYGLTDSEFTSPVSYPVNGGQAALMAGNGRQLADDCERVALVRPDTIAGDKLPALLNTGLAEGERAEAADILAAEDATNFTPQAKEAIAKAGAPASLAAEVGTAQATERAREGCVTVALGDRTDTFVDSFRRAQEDFQQVRISSVLGSVDQSLVDRTGGKKSPYEGAFLTGWYPAADDERWAPMRKVIKEHAFGDNRIEPSNAGVQTTWIAYTVFQQVVESLGDGSEVSARTVSRTLNDGLRVETGDLTPPLSWRFEDTIAGRSYPRLVNAHVTFQMVRDGRLVAARKEAVDVSTTLEQTT